MRSPGSVQRRGVRKRRRDSSPGLRLASAVGGHCRAMAAAAVAEALRPVFRQIDDKVVAVVGGTDPQRLFRPRNDSPCTVAAGPTASRNCARWSYLRAPGSRHGGLTGLDDLCNTCLVAYEAAWRFFPDAEPPSQNWPSNILGSSGLIRGNPSERRVASMTHKVVSEGSVQRFDRPSQHRRGRGESDTTRATSLRVVHGAVGGTQ